MELEQCINFILTKTQQKVHRLFKAELAAYGVTPGQYAVLKCLGDNNGLTAKQIAERLALDGSTITGLLDRLEQKALIAKHVDPHDRRALQVLLTEQGRALAEPLNCCIQKCNQKVSEVLSPEQWAGLKQVLEQIEGRIDSSSR